jgi:tRNA(Ile)-lysidine synthase TilS/MesJ
VRTFAAAHCCNTVAPNWLHTPAAHQLSWQDDESNSDEQHDRNYLRHQVLPQIEQRWPDYRQSWRKSLALLSENDDLQKQLGAIDLLDATTEMGGNQLGSDAGSR